MARLSTLFLILALALGGCGPDVPALEARIAAPGGASYPALVPLGPLLDRVDAIPPRQAAVEGPTLRERAADLRRRAALLRAMQI